MKKKIIAKQKMLKKAAERLVHPCPFITLIYCLGPEQMKRAWD
jgi:hypothetical protein